MTYGYINRKWKCNRCNARLAQQYGQHFKSTRCNDRFAAYKEGYADATKELNKAIRVFKAKGNKTIKKMEKA